MTIRKIATIGHPVLRQRARDVLPEELASPELQRLIDDLIDTMRDAQGAGLAANQVHEPVRVAVIEVDQNQRYPYKPPIPLTVLVNPVLTPMTEEMEDGWEGCLSVPDMRGMVPRFTSVRLDAYDREGNPIEGETKEFFAHVIQHETDHLQGMVYLDRMRDFSTLTHLAEWNRYWLGNHEQDD